MKTSNKLLILLALFFISTLILFNVLLKAQLAKGNVRYEYGESTRLSVPLKPFRHVMYDGRMITAYSPTRSSWVDRTMMVSTGDSCRLEMSSTLKSLLTYTYHGDTLFISFIRKEKRNGRADYVPEPNVPMQLFAPAFTSVSAVGGIMHVSGIDQEAPLQLYMNTTGQNIISNLALSELNLHVGTNTKVVMVNSNHIDTMALTMDQKSNMIMSTPIDIKTILTVKLDTSSRISVEGRSDYMKEYLQKMQ